MSKKLQANGLWESSRMMLPEHREALNQRGAEPEVLKKPDLPTQEEFRLIRESVILPMMLTIVEQNYRKIESTNVSLRKLYIAATQALMDRIHADLTKAKKELRERNIKVFEEDRIDSSARYRVFCRGYEDNFTIIRDVVRAEISVMLGKYISALFRGI